MSNQTPNTIRTLLICGGGGSEHDISVRSADFIQQQLATSSDIVITRVMMDVRGHLHCASGKNCVLDSDGKLHYDDNNTQAIDYVIPAIHGYPGETGDLQSWLDLINLPYFGSGPEANKNCFNKVTTKLWLHALGINNTPYHFLYNDTPAEVAKAQQALSLWGELFIKASNQGSSVGCYKVCNERELNHALKAAFALSPYVLAEKYLRARELEVAVYTYDETLCITPPGEICPSKESFYSYEEKYSANSRTKTYVRAQGLTGAQLHKIKTAAQRAFIGLKLKDLARIDFFLTQDGNIYLNEINTFPGMTSISLFPQMLKNANHDFCYYLSSLIRNACGKNISVPNEQLHEKTSSR